MKPLKILFVCDSSIGNNYLRQAVQYIDPKEAEVTICRLSAYPQFDDSKFDCLIYNTFPDEFHPGKFNSSLIRITDEKFWEFPGRALLFDSHDEGSKDAFTRFKKKYVNELPRIKTVPCYGDVRNIVISVPFAVDKKLMDASWPRTIPILYCAGLNGYLHDIRRQVFNILQPFHPFTERLPLHDYIKAMKSANISVVAPGYGTACVSHLESLAAGALLLAHESIRNTRLLPFADLVEDQHYVLYNLDNLEKKLRILLENPYLTSSIAKAGNQAFKQGYDLKRTANQVLKYFKQEAD
jgi:glycosyltransferase involved in cell wall biosynthesis